VNKAYLSSNLDKNPEASESQSKTRTMQQHEILSTAGFHNLMAGLLAGALREAHLPGWDGYQARLWLEGWAIPALQDMDIDTKALIEHVLEPGDLGKIMLFLG
jgi:hypothetical protein